MLVTNGGVRESWGVRYLAVLVLSISSGCLAEYVLPGGSRGDTGSSGDDTVASGDAPTGATGQGDSEDGCEAGTSRCGELCVDLQRDEEHCGGCDEVCKADEMCLVGECRDVIVLACEGCPCADQCPVGDQGVLASTTGEGGGEGGEGTGGGDASDTAETAESGGKDPQQRLCCEVEMQVLCVVGDADEVLVCPEGS